MDPEVRASLLKLYLQRLPALGDDDCAAVRADLGPDTLGRIERAGARDWLPLAFEVAIVRAVHRRRGDEGARELGRDVARASFDHAVFRPLISAMLGMLGRRPDVLLQLAMAGWSVAVRNGGRWAITSRADGEVRLAHHDVPEVWRVRGASLRVCGAAEALLAHGGLKAHVTVESAPDAPTARYTVSWGGRRRGGGGP